MWMRTTVSRFRFSSQRGVPAGVGPSVQVNGGGAASGRSFPMGAQWRRGADHSTSMGSR
ncbi:hypothetical protein GFS60_07363 (plasmid) [Rhodococcus sp. WAY2]|nr:hypothetical protein GFS60_07363 [Rhodococcus sp. WAY2]